MALLSQLLLVLLALGLGYYWLVREKTDPLYGVPSVQKEIRKKAKLRERYEKGSGGGRKGAYGIARGLRKQYLNSCAYRQRLKTTCWTVHGENVDRARFGTQAGEGQVPRAWHGQLSNNSTRPMWKGQELYLG